MALIKCPNCGKDVSDQVEKCIHCGQKFIQNEVNKKEKKCKECMYSLTDKDTICPNCGCPVEQNENVDTIVNNQNLNDSKKSKKQFKVISFLACCLLIIIMCVAVITILMKKSDVSVKNISIDKWKLLESGTYNHFVGELSCDTDKPFITLLGSYTNQKSEPKFVYMENGKGSINILEEKDIDPSIEYKIMGYFTGVNLKESDIKVNYNNEVYEDLYDSTWLTVEIQVSLKNKNNGFLFCQLSNDMSDEEELNCIIPIISGEGVYSYHLYNIPYKSRGVEIDVLPKLFCKSIALTSKDYNIEKEFELQKDDTLYFGKEEVSFNEYNDGLVLFSQELVEGGKAKERNKKVGNFAQIYDGDSELLMYFWAEDEIKEEPKYLLDLIGYLPLKSVK